jgi:hypothetical protein
MQSKKQIVFRRGSNFGEQKFDEKWRAENLFEIRFQLRTQTEADETAQTDVVGSAGEGFHVRGVDCGLANFFNVRRMTQTGERVAIEQFENFGLAAADAEQENAIGQTRAENRRAAFELFANVFAAISHRLKPTIRFFSHG